MGPCFLIRYQYFRTNQHIFILRGFIPFSRLTYAAYLLQFITLDYVFSMSSHLLTYDSDFQWVSKMHTPTHMHTHTHTHLTHTLQPRTPTHTPHAHAQCTHTHARAHTHIHTYTHTHASKSITSDRLRNRSDHLHLYGFLGRQPVIRATHAVAGKIHPSRSCTQDSIF